GQPRRSRAVPVREGARRPGGADAGRRRRRQRRSAARFCVGRTDRSVHDRGPRHRQQTARQAGLATMHSDHPRGRVQAVKGWSVRLRLTAWYGGLFLATAGLLIVVMNAILSENLRHHVAGTPGAFDPRNEGLTPAMGPYP